MEEHLMNKEASKPDPVDAIIRTLSDFPPEEHVDILKEANKRAFDLLSNEASRRQEMFEQASKIRERFGAELMSNTIKR